MGTRCIGQAVIKSGVVLHSGRKALSNLFSICGIARRVIPRIAPLATRTCICTDLDVLLLVSDASRETRDVCTYSLNSSGTLPLGLQKLPVSTVCDVRKTHS